MRPTRPSLRGSRRRTTAASPPRSTSRSRIDEPYNGAETKFTITSYLDFGTPTLQHIRTETNPPHGASEYLWSKSHFDGLGREIRIRSRGGEGKISVNYRASEWSGGSSYRTNFNGGGNSGCSGCAKVAQNGPVRVSPGMRASVAEVGWARFEEAIREIRQYRSNFTIATMSSRGSNAPPPAGLIGEMQRYANELRQSQSCSSPRPRGGVYGMWNPGTNRFEYVGRTVDLDVRMGQNSKSSRFEGMRFTPLAYTDVRAEQRGLEQSFMNLHGRNSSTGRPSLNQIRGISPSNPNRGLYEGAESAYREMFEQE
jgi:hypothetical protein